MHTHTHRETRTLKKKNSRVKPKHRPALFSQQHSEWPYLEKRKSRGMYVLVCREMQPRGTHVAWEDWMLLTASAHHPVSKSTVIYRVRNEKTTFNSHSSSTSGKWVSAPNDYKKAWLGIAGLSSQYWAVKTRESAVQGQLQLHLWVPGQTTSARAIWDIVPK